MNKGMSISEICRLVGLAPHTLRFYERHFPRALAPERTVGGHRVYNSTHLESLRLILKTIRDEKMSIQVARERMGEDVLPIKTEHANRAIRSTDSGDMVLEAFEKMCRKIDEVLTYNQRLDQILDGLLNERNGQARDELLTQIGSLRRENREMCGLLDMMRNRAPAIPVEAK